MISSPTNYFALADGGGIAPIVSLARDVLEREPESRLTLVYGGRDSSSMLFRDELHDLKDRYLSRFGLLFVLSHEAQDLELFSGPIDRAKVDALLGSWIDAASIDVAYVSGPPAITDAAVASLIAHGVARDKIETEQFAVEDASPLAGDVRAFAVLDGRRHAFTIERAGETILDAGLRQGLDLPYSCKGGVCSTCRVRLVEGEVEMDVHYALDDDEIARGFILMCQSYPATASIGIDVDAHGQV